MTSRRCLLLLACLVACASLVAATLDSGVAVGEESLLVRPSHADLHKQHTRREVSAGERIDWHKSIYNGIDRDTYVGANQPTQVRLAFIPGGMAVSYATSTAQSSPAPVLFGLTPQSITSSASVSEALTYGTLSFYTALLTNLQPKTRYYYQIKGDSKVSSFVTAPKVGNTDPYNVLVVGDMGLVNSANTMRQMQSAMKSVDWFLQVGDLSYADDFYLRKNDTYEGSWNRWQDLMTPITSASPYMTLPGNHECTCTEATPFLCPGYQRNFTAYRQRFRMPSKESFGVQNLWWSMDYGNVHWIQINTETDYPNSPMGPGTFYNAGPFGEQMVWLLNDLQKAAANRANVPWIIVSGHRPLYSSGHENKPVIAAFEALLLKFNVDIFFAGHVHWYERTWPLQKGGAVTANNYIQPQGIVHIINGAAGNIEGLSPSVKPLPYTAKIINSDYGYGKLSVANTTSIRWQYMRATDGAVVDDIWIHKRH